MSRILTVEQTAEKLQMSEDVVREYLRAGKLPGRKIGKSWRVVESDLESWISAGQGERAERVSARGFLKKYPGKLSSETVAAEKRLEAELEEAKLRRRQSRARKSA
ncbi:MAG: helix-turn-helix domain-containing protein [Armatimonadota bacterium]